MVVAAKMPKRLVYSPNKNLVIALCRCPALDGQNGRSQEAGPHFVSKGEPRAPLSYYA